MKLSANLHQFITKDNKASSLLKENAKTVAEGSLIQ